MMKHKEFQIFYEKSSENLWKYLLRLSGHTEIAQDIHQESYLRFLQTPPKQEAFAAQKSYLYTIATRLHTDRLRRSQKWKFWQTNPQDIHSSQQSARAGFEEVDLQVDLTEAFDKLKPRDRGLLWLAYVEDLSHHKIARILSVKESSVKVLLFRARKKLRKVLEEFELQEESLL